MKIYSVRKGILSAGKKEVPMMTTITGIMEWVLENIAGFAIVIFEFIGVAIIIWSGITGFIKWLKHAGDTGVYLARGLAMGLEFKMGSEILRTVVVREWKEIGIVAGIIALRAALTFLLHWEIKEEEKKDMERNVLDYEPHLALFVPDNDPLLYYWHIAHFGKKKLRRNGRLYFEINAACGNMVVEMLEEEGYKNIELIQDLSGRDRIIKARK